MKFEAVCHTLADHMALREFKFNRGLKESMWDTGRAGVLSEEIAFIC